MTKSLEDTVDALATRVERLTMTVVALVFYLTGRGAIDVAFAAGLFP